MVAGHRGFKESVNGYSAVERHDAVLAFRWDAVVKPDDVVWVLGDISVGGKGAQLKALEWIKQRPGIKHLISGNHDSCHPLHRDSHKWQRTYLEAFESVQMAAKRRVPLPDGHVSVMLSHFPYSGDHGADRYQEWRLRETCMSVIHGHTHSDQKLSLTLERGTPQIHVGVDAWNLTPVHWDEIVKIVQENNEN